MPNRLSAESSPYLNQHRDNPVDWWAWGEEAFAEARRLDRPVFVSIGYATCHWCHVMAHESFEDAATAAQLNDHFISIKVDREERPDVDAVYMNAIHVMGEGGGWPLSVFCLPDGRPFFLGTYFPKEPRFGRPSFRQLLARIDEAYRNEKASILDNASILMEGLSKVDAHGRQGGKADASVLADSVLIAAGRHIAQRCDARGGLAGAPKFPSSSVHDLLGRTGRLRFGQPARDAFLTWARAMADGGIYDHLGGGFARYSVDDRWLVPHFEKMLYDNGQLLRVMADAYSVSGERRFAEVIEETVAWLGREMTDPAGGLYAALDADSEGEEGKCYVWTPAQVRAVLGAADAIQFDRAYGVTDDGNFEHRTTVLSRVTARGAESDEVALREMRAKLLAARQQRVPPITDTKVLAGWNGLAISGLLRAWGATGHAPALAMALRVGGFLGEHMLRGGKLSRVYTAGALKLEGTLDDHAACALAFMDLAEATGDAAWWQRARGLVDAIRGRFVAESGGTIAFYMAAADSESPLVHRPESNHDGATPSGAAMAVEAMLRLGLVSCDDELFAFAERALAERVSVGLAATAQARWLAALDLYLNGQTLVVSAGEGRDPLLAAARRAYAPTLQLAGGWAAPAILADKTPGADGRARAFLCRGQTCSPPVSTAEELTRLIAGDARPS